MPCSSSSVNHRFARRNRYSLVRARTFLITYVLYPMSSFRIVSWRSVLMSLMEVPPFAFGCSTSAIFVMSWTLWMFFTLCYGKNIPDRSFQFLPDFAHKRPGGYQSMSSLNIVGFRVYRNNNRLSFPLSGYLIVHRWWKTYYDITKNSYMFSNTLSSHYIEGGPSQASFIYLS